jgi:hypothetical protein
MASVSAELSAQVAKLMNERLSRGELGPLLLGLSGGARGGRPRHVPTRRDYLCDTGRMVRAAPLEGKIIGTGSDLVAPPDRGACPPRQPHG